MNYLRLFFLGLFLFFSTALFAMGRAPDRTTESPLIGHPAADVVLTNSDGITGSVVASRQGNKAILIFWATWCPHCYEELGMLNEHMAAIKLQGIRIILVDVGESKEDVKNYFNRRQMKLTSFIDEDSYMIGTYHLIGVPTLIFIDEKGMVRNVTHVLPVDYVNYFGEIT